jgi:hypothetical protein
MLKTKNEAVITFLSVCSFLLLFYFSSYGQTITPLDSVEVVHWGKKLTSPWAGGINNGQFSEIDFDGDGKLDLFVFDRYGNRISTFLNRGGKDTVLYVFDPRYKKFFPKDITDWCLLRDMNCDGKPDILSSAGNGIKVYYNTSVNYDSLSFVLASAIINSDYGGGLISNLYVSRVDIPAIIDMDEDGDLDVLTFPVGGTKIEYHKNYSLENTGSCGINSFKLEDPCWGKVEEDFASNAVYFNVSCRGGVAPVQNQGVLHAGSTVFAFDLDNDHDMDVILGDISFPRATFLLNGGTKEIALITQQDSAFPSYNQSVNLAIFPAFYQIDVNNDNQKDIIVCPNSPNASDNILNVWYYKDVDTTKAITLDFQQKDFLQDQMIDVGEGAYPVFFDYNADGLQDLIIGNNSYKSSGTAVSKLTAYKNIGTPNSPKFLLETTNYANLLQYNPLQSLAPCFGDIDYDGDADMLLGCSTGELLFFENIAGPGTSANFVFKTSKFQNIDIGNFSKPTLFDIDGDNRLDLIIGGSDGKLTYYKDTATAGVAAFKLIKKNFGLVNVAAVQNNVVGYAAPVFVKEQGTTCLYLGTASGPIIKYVNIDNNLNGMFLIADSSVGNVNEGFRTHISLADITNDGKPEIVIGNFCGGVRLFTFKSVSSSIQPINLTNLKLYPNPAHDYLFADNIPYNTSYQIINLLGAIIKEGTCNSKEPINISGLTNGLYFFKLHVNNNSVILKIIKE